MLSWNCYYQNFNSREIETVDIFRHSAFLDDCIKAAKKYKDNKEVFVDAVRGSLMYYFWSKCEWEIQLTTWPYRDGDDMKKIDVFEQIALNWDQFADYIWDHRKELQKCKAK